MTIEYSIIHTYSVYWQDIKDHADTVDSLDYFSTQAREKLKTLREKIDVSWWEEVTLKKVIIRFIFFLLNKCHFQL